MFLSRSKDDKSQGGEGEGEGEGEAPSVDLTMAVPTSQDRSLGVTRCVSEVAQVADPSSSQTGSLRNFDMNRLPCGTDEEGDGDGEGEGDGEGGGGSSSAVSIVSPFLSPRKGEADRAQIEENHNNNSKNTLALRSNTSDHEDEEGAAHGGGGGAPPRKKLRLSKEQSALLEESFREHHTLNPKQKNALAKQLNLKSRQVEVWFQNRRARTKLKQTEVDCEFLKRCCESLTEENRRLQREVEELRAIKVAPPCVIAQDFYMPLPAATLTMCPSCERMGSTIDKRALTFAKPSYHVTNFRQPSAAC